MFVQIKNLGKIKKATIDLSKNLIVFTGKNNSGKTWVSYVIYSLFKSNIDKKNSENKKYFNEKIFEGINKEKSTKEIRFDKSELLAYFNVLLTKSFKENLPNYFANSKIDFSNFEITLSDIYCLDNKLLLLETENKEFISFEIFHEKNELVVKLVYHSGDLNIAFSTFFEKYKTIQMISKSLIDDLFILKWLTNVNSSFIPAERVGISVFSNDISANRINNVNSLNVVEYQLPIKDALQDWIRIPSFVNRTKENEFSKLAKRIELDILGGDLLIGEGGSIQFKIDDKNNLSYFNTASNIKSLASLIFYLKFYARKGSILFIDEPELNLHPNNQKKIAVYLSIISNLGVKVFVSTHSDYIIRELNNLIMLSKPNKKAKTIMKEYGYSNNEILKSENISAYFFDNGHAKQLVVEETGFEVESIDETIELQNEISNKLYFSLFDN